MNLVIPENALNRQANAVAVLMDCLGRRGVWASPDRYREQCWTRDFAMAILPLLLELGFEGRARDHLANLGALQRPDGRIPILFLDDEAAWVRIKEAQKARRAGDGEPFMLRRYREGQLWNLTEGTRDSEVWYLHAMLEYAERTGDRALLAEQADAMGKALGYIERELVHEGQIRAADWRDTMHVELGDKPLLTNNAALYRVYRMLGEHAKADALRASLLATHFVPGKDGDPGRFVDYPGTDRFDPLGGAFLALFEVVGPEFFPALAAGFASVDTPCGVTIRCKHKAGSNSRPDEDAVIERTGGIVIWPFVEGFVVLAALKMGDFPLAEAHLAKLLALPGFWEWHDPAEAARGLPGRGAELQGWSAFLLARAVAAAQAAARRLP